MSTVTDWLPYGRQNQLTMAKNWLTIFNTPGTGTDPGSSTTPADRWGVSGEAVYDLGGGNDFKNILLEAVKDFHRSGIDIFKGIM